MLSTFHQFVIIWKWGIYKLEHSSNQKLSSYTYFKIKRIYQLWTACSNSLCVLFQSFLGLSVFSLVWISPLAPAPRHISCYLFQQDIFYYEIEQAITRWLVGKQHVKPSSAMATRAGEAPTRTCAVPLINVQTAGHKLLRPLQPWRCHGGNCKWLFTSSHELEDNSTNTDNGSGERAGSECECSEFRQSAALQLQARMQSEGKNSRRQYRRNPMQMRCTFHVAKHLNMHLAENVFCRDRGHLRIREDFL